MKSWRKLLSHRAAVVSLFFLAVWSVLAVTAPLLPLAPPEQVFPGQQLLPPAWSAAGLGTHPLGTDDLGRDTLSRLIFGSRISLGFGFLCVLVSVLVGGVLGVTAGYWGGFWDRLVLRSRYLDGLAEFAFSHCGRGRTGTLFVERFMGRYYGGLAWIYSHHARQCIE